MQRGDEVVFNKFLTKNTSNKGLLRHSINNLCGGIVSWKIRKNKVKNNSAHNEHNHNNRRYQFKCMGLLRLGIVLMNLCFAACGNKSSV